MKLRELMERWDLEPQTNARPTERGSEIDWHNSMSASKELFDLVDKSGKIIRPALSKQLVTALQKRQDLIKKYGQLFIKKH